MEFDLTKVAKNALQNVVNNTLYRGKPIIDWINFIANNADDLISRQAAIDSLLEALYDLDEYDFVDKVFIEEELKRVPSVQTVQKTGRWIFEKGDGETCVDGYICSACGRSYHTKVPYFSEFHFCPSCGAKMENKKRLGIKPP